MGCSNAKQTLEGAIDDLKGNPTTGLVNLKTALEQAGKDTTQQESVIAQVPIIFELLPKAMEGLSEETPKPVLAACSVIERCVTVCNDPSLKDDAKVVIAGVAIMQCQSRLVALLKKSQEKAATAFRTEQLECDTSSKVLKAIALATVALFMLESHARECKQEFNKSGGIAITRKAMQPQSSGVQITTMESLSLMLSMFADTPENVEGVIAADTPNLLIPYVQEPKEYDVSKDMQSSCITVLEACLAHGQDVKNKDKIQAAIEKGASAWNSAYSMRGSKASKGSA